MFINTRTRCFMEAAKCLNFTRAAEKLYMSQPALSKNIAILEEECGMKLFYRDPRKNRVKLTEAGAVLLCELQKADAILDGTLDKAKRAAAGEEGRLVIALLSGQIFNETVKDVLNILDNKYPHVEVDKNVGGFRDLRTWLEDGTADMVVTFEEEARLIKDILYEEVNEVNIGFVVPKDNPLVKKKKLKIKDLEGQLIITPDDRETFTIYDRFRDLCLLEGFTPVETVAADLNHMNMMAEMGKGILITKEDSMVTLSPNVKFFRSDELGKATLVAAWKRDNLNPIITLYHRMYEEIYMEKKRNNLPT